MKKVFLTAFGLVALGMAPAVAADLPARTYTKAPAPYAPIYNWTGFYIGAMGGYGKEDTSGIGALSGGFAGGTVGYNWQSGQIVYGLEADAAWSDIGATAVIPGLLSVNDRIRDLGTVRGRIGFAVDQVLLYGTGGFAWADNRITATAGGVSISDSHVHTGWTAGAGVEVMFAPKWSVKAEYLYRSLSSENYFAGVIPGGVASGTLNINSGQIGVNYHF
ncbi:outer membrane protein [Bradyrhizobium sp.]|uniref:outer membrane protein n=1 Tax=Bradyrhizobium sp. TaxID=376 RepID=UPI003C744798